MKTLRQRPRMAPQTDERVPINITPEAREELRQFLTHDAEATGIGFSEFIRQSIRLWREIEPVRPGRKVR